MKKGKPRKPNKRARASVVIDTAGVAHTFVNCAVPQDKTGRHVADIRTSICARCTHAYSHLMRTQRGVCDECRLEACAAWGLSVQERYGVNLGWQTPEVIHKPERVSRVDLPKTIVIKQPGPAARNKPKKGV